MPRNVSIEDFPWLEKVVLRCNAEVRLTPATIEDVDIVSVATPYEDGTFRARRRFWMMMLDTLYQLIPSFGLVSCSAVDILPGVLLPPKLLDRLLRRCGIQRADRRGPKRIRPFKIKNPVFVDATRHFLQEGSIAVLVSEDEANRLRNIVSVPLGNQVMLGPHLITEMVFRAIDMYAIGMIPPTPNDPARN